MNSKILLKFAVVFYNHLIQNGSQQGDLSHFVEHDINHFVTCKWSIHRLSDDP